jgi:hypothetical protein
MPMTDPHDALPSLQAAFAAKRLHLNRCSFDSGMWVHQDTANGKVRVTYIRNEGRTVVAFATFVLGQPFEGAPCFDAGWAVPTSHRRQGLATRTVKAALIELTAGFGPYGPFWIEAVVGMNNLASQTVAERGMRVVSVPMTDSVSGLPALIIEGCVPSKDYGFRLE